MTRLTVTSRARMPSDWRLSTTCEPAAAARHQPASRWRHPAVLLSRRRPGVYIGRGGVPGRRRWRKFEIQNIRQGYRKDCACRAEQHPLCRVTARCRSSLQKGLTQVRIRVSLAFRGLQSWPGRTLTWNIVGQDGRENFGLADRTAVHRRNALTTATQNHSMFRKVSSTNNRYPQEQIFMQRFNVGDETSYLAFFCHRCIPALKAGPPGSIWSTIESCIQYRRSHPVFICSSKAGSNSRLETSLRNSICLFLGKRRQAVDTDSFELLNVLQRTYIACCKFEPNRLLSPKCWQTQAIIHSNKHLL
jgi:hypothetical protein